MTPRTRCYTELCTIRGYEERFSYLRLSSQVGQATFGFDRYLNQRFYSSPRWRHARNLVIARDSGRDLGIEGYEIHDRVAIHHMNPVTPDGLINEDDSVFDPEFLITVSHRTHNAIHFGDERLLSKPPVIRRPGDTKLW